MMPYSHYRGGEVDQADESQHFDRGRIFGALKLLLLDQLSSKEFSHTASWDVTFPSLWDSNAKLFNMHASS